MPPVDPEQMKAAIMQEPVSVAIQSQVDQWQHYKSGVITSIQCYDMFQDHAVLAFGYGILDGEEYFLLKNSVGADWGDNGYARVSTSKKKICGVLTYGSYPTIYRILKSNPQN